MGGLRAVCGPIGAGSDGQAGTAGGGGPPQGVGCYGFITPLTFSSFFRFSVPRFSPSRFFSQPSGVFSSSSGGEWDVVLYDFVVGVVHGLEDFHVDILERRHEIDSVGRTGLDESEEFELEAASGPVVGHDQDDFLAMLARMDELPEVKDVHAFSTAYVMSRFFTRTTYWKRERGDSGEEGG